MMSDSVTIGELTHCVDKAFVPSPTSPYSSITTTTRSFSSSSPSSSSRSASCPYSSSVTSLSPSSIVSSLPDDFLSSSSTSSPSTHPSSPLSPNHHHHHYRHRRHHPHPYHRPSSPAPSSLNPSSPSSPSPSSPLQPPPPQQQQPSSSSSSSSTSSTSSSSSSNTIPLTPPPTPPTPSAPACQMTFQEAVHNGNTMELRRLLEDREGKININLFDQEGQTALHQVCLKGSLELVKLLVRFGADVGLANRDGWNPLHIAAYGGHMDILCYLSTVPRKKKPSLHS